jgi:hypothetical protein
MSFIGTAQTASTPAVEELGRESQVELEPDIVGPALHARKVNGELS